MKQSVIRFGVYTIIIFLVTSSLPILIEHGDVRAFKENNVIEWLQFFLLLGSFGAFISAARKDGYKEFFTALLFITGFALVRELDSLLDALIPYLGWELFSWLITIFGVVFVFRNYSRIKDQLRVFIRTRPFTMLWCGFVVAVPVAQLVGHGDFLKSVMGDDYDRNYKRVIEEICELIGYLLLLMGAFEALIEMRCGRWKTIERDELEKQSKKNPSRGAVAGDDDQDGAGQDGRVQP